MKIKRRIWVSLKSKINFYVRKKPHFWPSLSLAYSPNSVSSLAQPPVMTGQQDCLISRQKLYFDF